MKVAPRLMVALLLALGGAGCRTAGVAPPAPLRTTPQPRLSFDMDEFVSDHNRNSNLIRSLEAKPAITVAMVDQAGKARKGQVDGRLALERPRNFKLELSSFRSSVADIGSNDERFWFWVQSEKDKSVYVCDYADLDSTTLAVTYQPDWIVEALGLKEITPDDAARVKISRGPEDGTTGLTFPARKTSGQSYSRVMIVNDLSRRVTEYRIYAGDSKTLVAQATIKKYLPVGLKSSEANSENTSDVCYLPDNVVLEWKREQLTLNVALRDLKVNQFKPARRTALFVEPSPSGYSRVNLAEVTRTRESESQTSVRESMPIPESRNRVRLAPPLRIQGADAASRSTGAARPNQVGSQSPMLLPILEEVLGAPIPTAPSSEAERTANLSRLQPGGVTIER